MAENGADSPHVEGMGTAAASDRGMVVALAQGPEKAGLGPGPWGVGQEYSRVVR